MNLSFRQLEAFVAVARHTNFTRASEELHMTQAGLSAMIRELEAQVGIRLFERTTRRVRLTPAGERLLPVATRALAEIGSAFQGLRELGTSASARLRVGITPLMATSVLPAVLARIGSRHPQARIEIFDIDRSLIQDGVETGTLDLGLGAFFDRDSGLKREAILPSHLMLAVADDGRPLPPALRWETMDTDNLLTLPSENPIQKLADRQIGARYANNTRRAVTHLETALAMVSEGLGRAIVPSFAMVAARRWRVRLVSVRPAASCDYYRIERAGHPPSSLANAFVDEFLAVMLEENDQLQPGTKR